MSDVSVQGWKDAITILTADLEAAEATIERLRAALDSLDFLDDDYVRWPHDVKRKVDEALTALNEGNPE